VKKNFFTLTRICNLLCAVLLLVMLCLQFLPYWNHSGRDVTIADYTWNPQTKENKKLTKQFEKVSKSYGEEYDINDLVTGPIILMAAAAVTVALCCIGSNKTATALVPAIGAGVGINGFMSNLVLRMNPMWMAFVGICAVILVLALAVLVVAIIKTIKRDRAILAERAAKAQ